MSSIRDRLFGVLFREERDRLDRAYRATRAFGSMLRENPSVVAKVGEMDDSTLEWIRRQTDVATESMWWDPLGEQARMMAVRKSRRQCNSNPAAERQIETWTDYGFGYVVDVDPEDPIAKGWWDTFWGDAANRPVLVDRHIHDLSRDLLVDGELFLVFFTDTVTGRTRIRVVPTDEVVEVVTSADDVSMPLYYKREFVRAGSMVPEVVYYPDFLRTREELGHVDLGRGLVAGEDSRIYQLGGEELRATRVSMMHVAINGRGRPKRGWPMLSTSSRWLDAYNEFLEARLAVAKAVYLFVDKIKASGGSRAVDAIESMIRSELSTSAGSVETNPLGAPGGVWVENEALSRSRNPLGTGASDAEKDSAAFLAMAGGSGRIPALMLGRGELVRMAVADQMMEPVRRQWKRYQTFWRSVWMDIANYVLDMGKEYAHLSYGSRVIDIQLDPLSDPKVGELSQVMLAISGAYSNGAILDAGLANRMIEAIMRSILQVSGVSDLDAVFGEVPDTSGDYSPTEEPEVPEEGGKPVVGVPGGNGGLTSEEFDSLVGAAARAVLRGS